MSQPSRPLARRPEKRRDRKFQLESIALLETKQLLAPILTTGTTDVTLVPVANSNNTAFIFRQQFTQGGVDSAAEQTSVSMLTSLSQFGGDMVRIEAGPGGDFGRGVYAISRGAPGFRDPNSPVPINKPGMIYRVDPATGETSPFFDLGSVMSQLPQVPPDTTPTRQDGSNGVVAEATGLKNWYDITFDLEGYFDGRPSMFVSSVDEFDPRRNAIYQIGPDGTLYGMFMQGIEGIADVPNLTLNPTAILAPPPEQQAFLSGLIAGDGQSDQPLATTASNAPPRGGFNALYFNSDSYRPGQRIASKSNLPNGVTQTKLTAGPQTSIIAANSDYSTFRRINDGVRGSSVYSTFTDFGLPYANVGGSNAETGTPGMSGIQGINGEFLIGAGSRFNQLDTVDGPDQSPAVVTPYRRFMDSAFDQYGYFSYGKDVTDPELPFTYQGSLFVADNAPGINALMAKPTGPADPNNQLQNAPANVLVPIIADTPFRQIYDSVHDRLLIYATATGVSTGGSNETGLFGGRVMRVNPNGEMEVFASNFNVGDVSNLDLFTGDIDTSIPYLIVNNASASDNQDRQFTSAQPLLTAASMFNSNLSITFSADGTTLYVSDLDGIWQFKTTNSLAGSTSGTITGLNDLRTLGVPYDGIDSAVAVIDSGVDATTAQFRGRVANGTSILFNGKGNDDLAPGIGHGTGMAGIISQFVPQATLQPVNVFRPTPGGGVTTTANAVFRGLKYTADNPFVNDPIRPNKQDRVIAAAIGFGTTNLYATEGQAFQEIPQIVGSFKNQATRLRRMGITTVAAAGQELTPTSTTPESMAIPALIREVVSVTGTYSYPFRPDAQTTPDDPASGFIPRPPGPWQIYRGPNQLPNEDLYPNINALATADGTSAIFKDKLLNAVNRNSFTDFAAPALDTPTFARNTGALGTNTLDFGGTSASSAMVTGSFAMVGSALNYWTKLAAQGYTVDAYLTQPVDSFSLDYKQHFLKDLSAYSNPDGINSILQWTAVPATDNDPEANPPELIGHVPNFGPNGVDDGGPNYRNFSRIDIGNAIAAIEGSVALDYLIRTDQLKLIDANNNGLLTAQEVQDFVDKAPTIGLAEAGAMARLLGGTKTTPINEAYSTFQGEDPDQLDALQRRFNFFDFAADGQRNGSVSIEQLTQLSHTLLPTPNAFSVPDRLRSSTSGYLVDPTAPRGSRDLQYLSKNWAFINPAKVKRFRNLSPAQLGVRGGPAFSLYETQVAKNQAAKKAAAQNNGNEGGNQESPSGDSGKNGKAGGSQDSPSGRAGSNTTPNKPTDSGTQTPPVTDQGTQTPPATGNGNGTAGNGTATAPTTPPGQGGSVQDQALQALKDLLGGKGAADPATTPTPQAASTPLAQTVLPRSSEQKPAAGTPTPASAAPVAAQMATTTPDVTVTPVDNTNAPVTYTTTSDPDLAATTGAPVGGRKEVSQVEKYGPFAARTRIISQARREMNQATGKGEKSARFRELNMQLRREGLPPVQLQKKKDIWNRFLDGFMGGIFG